jgi:Ca-activated chloride channel homolog
MSGKKLFCVFALIVFLIPLNINLFAQTAPDDDEVIKVDVALVNIPVIVSDKAGRYVPGLTLENFSLFDDGKPQKIEYLSTHETPLNIVLLLDTSRSAEEIIEKIRNAAWDFIKQLRPADRCMIISFDESARVKSEFTDNQKRLEGAIKRTVMSQKDGTLLRDAIFVTVDKELVNVKGRKAVILLTDGKDLGSSVSKQELIYRLKESDAPIYSIFYETLNYGLPIGKDKAVQVDQKKFKQFKASQEKKNLEAVEFLQYISDVTGGRIFPKDLDNLGDAFKSIADELRNQYLVSFYPEESNYEISRHQIKIKVDKSGVIVRTKNVMRLKPAENQE